MSLPLEIALLFVLLISPFGASSSCSRDSALSKARRVEGIKQEILQRLGLVHAPVNPPSSTAEDAGFLQEYELANKLFELGSEQKPPCASLDFNSLEVLNFYPKSVEGRKRSTNIAANVECPSDLSVDFNDNYTMTFDVNLQDREFVTSAQLKLTRTALLPKEGDPFDDQLDVKLLVKPENYYNEYLSHYATTKLLSYDDKDELLVIDITKDIAWWLDNNKDAGKSNVELKLEMHLHCSRTLPNGTSFVPNFQFATGSRDSQLVVKTYLSEHRRRKRQDGQEDGQEEDGDEEEEEEEVVEENNTVVKFCGQEQLECCLNELSIDFRKDLNWTWIIKPKEISFHYCSGECPINWGQSTQHAQYLDRFRSRVKKNPVASAKPCCVPNTYRSLTVATYLDNVHNVTLLEDIVATSCACR